MRKPSDTRRWIVILIFVLAALSMARLAIDPRIPHSLTFERVEPALPYLLFFETFEIQDLKDAMLYEPTKITGRVFPPLGYMLLGAFFALFGVGSWTIILFNLLFAAASLWLIDRLGRKTGFHTAGFLGAVLFASFWIVGFFVQEFTLEITVTPFLLAAALLLMNEDIFIRTRPTLAAAAAIGLGTLVRHDVAAHLAIPAAYLLWLAVGRQPGKSRSSRLFMSLMKFFSYIRNHGLLAIAFAAISLGPFLLWFLAVRSIGVTQKSFANDGVYVVGYFIYNLATLLLAAIGPVLAPIVLIGFFQYIRARSFYPHRGFLHAFLFSGLFLLLVLKKSADPQHWIPFLPVVALIAAMGLEKIRSGFSRRALLGVALGLGGLSFLLISQSYLTLRLADRLLGNAGRNLDSKGDLQVLLYVFDEALIRVNLNAPDREDHLVGKIVRDILRAIPQKAVDNQTVLIDDTLLKASVFSNLYLNAAHFPYYAWQEDPKRASRLKLKIGVNLEQIDDPGEPFVLLGSNARGYEETIQRLEGPESRHRLCGTYPALLPKMNLDKSEEGMKELDMIGIAVQKAAAWYRKQPPVIWQEVTIDLFGPKPGGLE